MRKKLNIAIVVLSILLVLSMGALIGTIVYFKYGPLQSSQDTVPNNYISSGSTSEIWSFLNPFAITAYADDEKPAELSLYARHAEENIPFDVKNMFPGDSESKDFRVQISHKNTVHLHFHADVRPGYEKLSEALNIKIELPDENTVLYDGLVKDMPDAVSKTLVTNDEGETVDVLYRITASLNTSVGNEYQEKELISDFRWWIVEEENLTPAPTGDMSYAVYIILAVITLAVSAILIVVLVKSKKEDKSDNKEAEK